VNKDENLSNAIKDLSDLIARLTEHGELLDTEISGLSLYRREEPTEPIVGMYEPSICMAIQGAKRVFLGDDSFVYDSHHYLITSVHLPTTVQIVNASSEAPYLGLKLVLDQQQMVQLIADSNLPMPKDQKSNRGMAVGTNTEPLIRAFKRLVVLLAEPKDIPILAPIIQREIHYRLLVGDQGMRLRQIALSGSQSHQIARIVDWIKKNFKENLRIEALADRANMSTSTFHHHFRSITALSPIQYIKQLRLQEARRLMLTEDMNAGDAAFNVGYESPSQFTREYSRLFGVTPKLDIKSLNQLAGSASA